MVIKQKGRQSRAANRTLLFLVTKQRLVVFLQFGAGVFRCFFGRKMHRIGSRAKFEVELQFAFEKVTAAVWTLLVFDFWVESWAVGC